MKISGIYRIQSIIKPERFYIGSAISISDRWSKHKSLLRKNAHHSPKLQNHFNKYGEADIVFIIIEPCLSEFLLIREQYYIDTLKPWFNTRQIAESNLGYTWNKDSRDKMRGNKNGAKKRSAKTKENIRKSKLGNKNALGCKRSDGFKENLRIIKLGNNQGLGNKSRTGQINSLESNESRSKSMRGKKNALGSTPWNKGKKAPYSKETLDKMSAGQKNRYLNKTA